MGDRAAGQAATVSQSPGQDPGALREAVGPPTKAGAAPPRRGLPDEGVAALDLPWSDGSHPWRGDGQRDLSLRLPNRERREVAPARSPKARTAGESWMKGVEGAPRGERTP
jgi:hypothetical protein